ncbi:MAG: hypothetical protein ACLRR3_12495 [Eubacterium sp.]
MTSSQYVGEQSSISSMMMRVLSAPNIQAAITGGQADRLTGEESLKEAEDTCYKH